MKIGRLFLLGAVLFCCVDVQTYAAKPDSLGNGFRFPLRDVGALTSSFGEYRTGHFHAGLDLSTDGKIGMPVVAIRSGYVCRVRVSGAGYGKAVDLLLDNGMLASYAHLEKFSDKIEAYARSRQLEKESYEIDVSPEPFQIPVEIGETIGLSGNTGFSFGPHLHFELKQGEVSLNPVLKEFPMADHVPPTFRFVKLTPLDPSSSINGSDTPGTFSLRRSAEGGGYTCSTIPVLSGNFLVGVSVFDQTEKASNKLCVYGLQLFVDDSLLFESAFDRIESSRSQEVALGYDYGLAKRGQVYTHNLCRFEGSKLRLLQKLPAGAGTIDSHFLSASFPHTLRIIATDASGNRSSAVLRFKVRRDPVVDSVSVLAQDSSLLLYAVVESNGSENPRVWLDYDLGTTGGRVSQVLLEKDSRPSADGRKARFAGRIKLQSGLYGKRDVGVRGTFRVRAEDIGGATSKPYTLTLVGNDSIEGASVNLDFVRTDGFAEITARTSPEYLRPKIGIANGDTVWLQVTEEGAGRYKANYEFEPVLTDAATALCVLSAGGSGKVIASKKLGVHTIKKGWEGRVWNEDGTLGVFFGPETFYRDTYLTIEKGERNDLPDGLAYASEVFTLGPDDVIFDKGATVVIRCGGGASSVGGVGLYQRNSARKWSYVGSVVDTLAGTVGASVKAFSDVALIKDEVPPSIGSVHPRAGTVSHSSEPNAYAVIRDVGSGLGWQGMKTRLDGKTVLSEWDPRISRLTVVYNEPLSAGEHTLVFEIRDRAGNMSQAETRFRIAR